MNGGALATFKGYVDSEGLEEEDGGKKKGDVGGGGAGGKKKVLSVDWGADGLVACGGEGGLTLSRANVQ